MLDPDAGDLKGYGSSVCAGPRAAPKSFWSICAACFTGSITGCTAVSGVCLLHAVGLAYAITILLFILSRLMPLPDNLAVHSLFHRNSPACCSA